MKKAIVLVFGLLILGALAALRWSVTVEPVDTPERVERIDVGDWAPADRGHRLEGEGFVATAEAVAYTDGDAWMRFSRGVAAEVVHRDGGVVERHEPLADGIEQSLPRSTSRSTAPSTWRPTRRRGGSSSVGARRSSIPATAFPSPVRTR